MTALPMSPAELDKLRDSEPDLNEVNGVVDFFGGRTDTAKWYFPGQETPVQYIEFRKMNEGQRKKYQRKTSRDIKVNRKTQESAIGMDIAGDREALIQEVVCGWYIIDGKTGQSVPFDAKLDHDGRITRGGTFMQWMDRADPRLIDKLELAIRDENPWMQDEMDPDSIQEEIDRLVKLKDEVEKRAEFQG